MVDIAIEGGPTTLFPFRTEVHFVLPRGESGFYAYAIYEHGAGMPAATIGQTRFTIKGVPGTRLFTDHVVDDRRMGPYPASPIVRQVMDATFLLEDGTVYTKYNNTAFMADHHLHGMTGHGLGLWMITPSNDYVNGGPLKQELTVHKDNVLLAMLQGAHFGSGELTFADGEEWTKFYGPVFVYCNSGATTADMYADAKQRAHREMSLWPYQWVDNADYPLHRGTVKGRIALTDGASTEGAWIVLAATGGDWPLQGKGYQFWTKAGKNGEFTIEKVRPGTYTLYACGANQFDQFHHEGVAVSASATTDLGKLDWKPVKHGRTIWQIGTADRSTQEYKNGES
jgi:rhamnogalacturonan endolyase